VGNSLILQQLGNGGQALVEEMLEVAMVGADEELPSP
jgi:hypothetical protein